METTIQLCLVCAMRVEAGQGFVKRGDTFCCEGCASGTGCTCPDEI